MPFERWEENVWEDPLLSLDGSFEALVDGRVAAATNLRVSGEPREQRFHRNTARLPRARPCDGRQEPALRWAAGHGVERVHTFNDEENAAMLRVNEKLGYRPWLVALDVERSS